MREDGGQRIEYWTHFLVDIEVTQKYNECGAGERETEIPGLNLCPSTRELNGRKGQSWSFKQVSKSLWVSAASSENEMGQINNLLGDLSLIALVLIDPKGTS